jgi:nucleoside 2-deoxyribosyltransferase
MTTYLCGGINGLSDDACTSWREKAKTLLLTSILDPMRRDYRGREDESVTEIIYEDLKDIEESAFILVNATRPSWGTAMEIVYAFQKNKTIVAFTEGVKISPWLRFHCHHIVETVEEGCLYLNALKEKEEE